MDVLSISRIDADAERAVRAFLKQVEDRYCIIACILYGERARGNISCDNEPQLAVILRGAPGDRIAAGLDMAGVAFDVMIETGLLVHILPLWDEELHRPDGFANPGLIAGILREGVVL